MFFINLQMFTAGDVDSATAQFGQTHVNVTTQTREYDSSNPFSTEGYDAVTTGGLSPEMKVYYDRNLIREAGPQLIHDQFGQKRNIPKNGGKQIEFRKFSPLPKAMTPITEGVTPKGKRLDVTAMTAEVSQYGDYIVMSDVLQMTAIDPVLVEATKLLGQQSGLTKDTITRDIIANGSNVNFVPKKNSSGVETAVTARSGMDTTCVLTIKEIQKAVTKLKGMNAPKINGKYVGIIHPYNSYQLMRDPEWINVKTYQDSSDIYAGEIGEIAGVRFVETTEAKVWNDSTCPANGSGKYHSVFATLILGANAYGTTEIEGMGLQTVVKPLGAGDDPLNQRSTAGWKLTATAERLIEAYTVRIESCVPDYDATPAN